MQGGHLSSADQADPAVAAYLNAALAVRRLEGELDDARANADALLAAVDTAPAGETSGRLGRLAAHLGVKAQSLKNQRQRGKNPSQRRATARGIARRVLTDAEYEAALQRADTEARHQVPGPTLDAIVSGALAAVGLLTPPPEPDGDGTCTALFADPEGEWLRCREEPHGGGRHDAGEWAWGDDDPNTIPART